jgi:hypothetical protein
VVKADKAFRRSNMGKKVARALRTLEQAGLGEELLELSRF